MASSTKGIKISVLGGVKKYAHIHEFGGKYHPKRSFIKTPIEKDEYKKVINKEIKHINLDKKNSFINFFDNLGLSTVGYLQKYISQNKIEPKTKIKRLKGRKTTLIDKGILRRSIYHGRLT